MLIYSAAKSAQLLTEPPSAKTAPPWFSNTPLLAARRGLDLSFQQALPTPSNPLVRAAVPSSKTPDKTLLFTIKKDYFPLGALPLPLTRISHNTGRMYYLLL